jgi:predicted RNA-binding Zn ribbon-like protein
MSTPYGVRMVRMSVPAEPIRSGLVLPAGAEDLCLGFANTRYWRGTTAPSETLSNFGDLLRWLAEAAILPIAGMDWAGMDTGTAGALFSEAIALRETIYRSFSALAFGEPVPAQDLAILNRALADAPARLALTDGPAGYFWETAAFTPSAAVLLAPVIWSAADLLTRADHRRIRRCANDQCLWLFVDESKTGTRRWCDMASCGNRAKSRRHYLKTKRG